MSVWGRQRRSHNLLDLARNSATWPNIIITFIPFFLCASIFSHIWSAPTINQARPLRSYRVLFLAVPPRFQYPNEKTCSANEKLFYIENFLKKKSWLAATCNSFWYWKSGGTVKKSTLYEAYAESRNLHTYCVRFHNIVVINSKVWKQKFSLV